jgi:hypothetical protein
MISSASRACSNTLAGRSQFDVESADATPYISKIEK